MKPQSIESIQPWDTPLLMTSVPDADDLNVELRRVILENEERKRGPVVGTVEANKTQSDLLKWDYPIISQIRDLVTRATSEMESVAGADVSAAAKNLEAVAEAWAVVYHEWGHHKIHSHHDSAWSGVYYVHTGEMADGTGMIEFIDPRTGAAATDPRREPWISMSPQPGTLICFPSWLQHWVTPYDGDAERICIAFNVGYREA